MDLHVSARVVRESFVSTGAALFSLLAVRFQNCFRLRCEADVSERAALTAGVGEEFFDEAGCLQSLQEAAAFAERDSGQAVLAERLNLKTV